MARTRRLFSTSYLSGGGNPNVLARCTHFCHAYDFLRKRKARAKIQTQNADGDDIDGGEALSVADGAVGARVGAGGAAGALRHGVYLISLSLVCVMRHASCMGSRSSVVFFSLLASLCRSLYT